jgi:hypothetical protein
MVGGMQGQVNESREVGGIPKGSLAKSRDSTQIPLVPGTEYQDLLRRKTLQLLDRERVKFKIKLAGFLGRLTDEEVTAGLENPWLARMRSKVPGAVRAPRFLLS